MGTITIRVNETEEAALAQIAKLYGATKSALLKQLAFEKLEEEYDLAVVKDYENKKARGEVKTRPIEELFAELEL